MRRTVPHAEAAEADSVRAAKRSTAEVGWRRADWEGGTYCNEAEYQTRAYPTYRWKLTEVPSIAGSFFRRAATPLQGFQSVNTLDF